MESLDPETLLFMRWSDNLRAKFSLFILRAAIFTDYRLPTKRPNNFGLEKQPAKDESDPNRGRYGYETERELIVDECMAPGGFETRRLNLVPELAKLCESIVWALPLPYGEALRERIQQRNIPNLEIENLLWPRDSIQQIQAAALRRVPRVPLLASYAGRLIRKSVDLGIRRLAEKHGSVCCLTTSVFGQPPPVSDLPLAGFVCDVNPILPEWIRKNIVRWAPAAQATFGISEFTCRPCACLRRTPRRRLWPAAGRSSPTWQAYSLFRYSSFSGTACNVRCNG